ncbi:MAG: P-II family nitrogen regulator [Clostridia bacterium]|jgi:nitrogen regulatory protein P-II 1|nr:P-II family nitrogen regulator [Clostridia bacterium]
MKKIEAVIRPSRLEGVKTALSDFGISGITITQVVGCGLQKGQTEFYRGNPIHINLLPKIKLEIVVKAEQAEDVIKIIIENAKTGKVGDGKIFIQDISGAIRIRTGEKDRDAL